MSTESYSLIINSQNAVNRDSSSGNINSYKYFINWDSVLPKKYSTFDVGFTLKSVNTATNITVNALVGIDFGQTNLFDQTINQSRIIGITYPVPVQQTANTWNYFYSSTLNDNQPVTISYPTNQMITVSFTNFDLTTPLTMYHYVLQLTFTPHTNKTNQDQIFLNSI
jgi:hypothetical protein